MVAWSVADFEGLIPDCPLEFVWIQPLVSAEKPAGEWQTVDITLVDRHVTVKLNGKLVQDNAPLLGCTGGALWSDEFRPGPIYLQGDHSGVSYRNMVLRPVVK